MRRTGGNPFFLWQFLRTMRDNGWLGVDARRQCWVWDLPAIRQRCLQEGVIVSLRGGGLRISPHAYNHEQDVDRLVDVLRSASGDPKQ